MEGEGFLIICSRHTLKRPILPWEVPVSPGLLTLPLTESPSPTPTGLQDTWFWGRRVAPKAPNCTVVEGPAI